MRPNHLGLATLGLMAGTGLVFLLLLLAGCTTIGTHDHAALPRMPVDSEPTTLSLCAYLDEGITAGEAATLLDQAWREDGARYGILIRIAETRPWTRPAFAAEGIMNALRQEPLAPPCDRLMAFVGRHAGDALWGLFLPQALGAVDAETRARGFVVARVASLDQAAWSPAHVLNHELHHMLGCDHELTLATCYDRIAALKRAHARVESRIETARDLDGAEPGTAGQLLTYTPPPASADLRTEHVEAAGDEPARAEVAPPGVVLAQAVGVAEELEARPGGAEQTSAERQNQRAAVADLTAARDNVRADPRPDQPQGSESVPPRPLFDERGLLDDQGDPDAAGPAPDGTAAPRDLADVPAEVAAVEEPEPAADAATPDTDEPRLVNTQPGGCF